MNLKCCACKEISIATNNDRNGGTLLRQRYWSCVIGAFHFSRKCRRPLSRLPHCAVGSVTRPGTVLKRRIEGRQQLNWDIHKLFRRHARGIAKSLHRRGINEDTAADLTQDTFLRVIATPPAETTQNYNPKAYLYQAARNLGLNHQRREALIETVPLDDEEAVNIPDPAPSPEKIVYSRQCLVQTQQALSELPERTRQAFEMHRLGERTIAEVAEELGISTTRAWSLIRDAYRHLVGRVDAF